ncbi:MAG: hemolysin family protein [Deinococcales bacterium]
MLSISLAFMVVLAQNAQDAGGGSSISSSQIFLLVLFLIISGFFSGSETSFTAIGQWKIRQLHEEGQKVFGLLERDPTRFITTCLIGSNLANIGATALITKLGITFASLSNGRLSENAALGITTAITTVLILIFGEITPKALAVHHAERVANFAIRPVYAFSVVLYPIGLTFTWMASMVLRLLRLEPPNNPLITESELQLMLRSAEESDVIEAHEREMIEGVIELEETLVREVMTPRVEVIAVEQNTPLVESLRLFEEHMFSRLPVYEDTLDNIKGIFLVRDLLKFLHNPTALQHTKVSELMTQAQYVPETLSILNLLKDMRMKKNHIAVVVDEFGGTAGIISLEDIIEEITGEIYDESDHEEELDIRFEEDGSYYVQGSAHLEDVGESLGIVFENEAGDYDTVAGFLISKLGYIPARSESYLYQNYRFSIEEADERRIIAVRVHKEMTTLTPSDGEIVAK